MSAVLPISQLRILPVSNSITGIQQSLALSLQGIKLPSVSSIPLTVASS